MNIARVVVLVVAVGAAAGALILGLNSRGEKQLETVPVAVAPPVAATDDVLVAADDLQLGKITVPEDFQWQPWPKDAINPVMIKKSDNDKIVAELAGSIVRANVFKGEPIRRERLIKGSGSGFLSAILPSGMRAVAINIDSQGANSAGGFILPNDKVDVIRTVKPEGGQQNTEFTSETILKNVKVLAIGQNVQEKNGQSVVVGSNATLELEPVQAETIILAQRTGQLSLVLRSILDSAPTAVETDKPVEHGTTIVRYGVSTESAVR